MPEIESDWQRHNVGPKASFPKGTHEGYPQKTLPPPRGLISPHGIVCGWWVQTGGIGGEPERRMHGWVASICGEGAYL